MNLKKSENWSYRPKHFFRNLDVFQSWRFCQFLVCWVTSCYSSCKCTVCVNGSLFASLQPKSSAARQKLVKKLVNKENKTRLKLEALGIDYKFPGYVSERFAWFLLQGDQRESGLMFDISSTIMLITIGIKSLKRDWTVGYWIFLLFQWLEGNFRCFGLFRAQYFFNNLFYFQDYSVFFGSTSFEVPVLRMWWHEIANS